MKGEIELPVNRTVNWRVILLLAVLQLLGNIAAIPLHYASSGSHEPLSDWIAWTLISIPLIALATHLSSRVGLGAPILEGYMTNEERSTWIREVVGYIPLAILPTLPIYIYVNEGIDMHSYPPYWQLLLASIQAGVREEIFTRLLLMSLFVWFGSRLIKQEDGRPTSGVIWGGNLLSAIIFGLAHIDDTPYSEELLLRLFGVFTANAFLGLFFGWLFWRYGLEAAMLAHFAYDGIGSTLLIPVFLWGSALMKGLLFVVLVVCGVGGWVIVKG